MTRFVFTKARVFWCITDLRNPLAKELQQVVKPRLKCVFYTLEKNRKRKQFLLEWAKQRKRIN